MSRKGNCWDNVVAESLFASLKKERVQWRQYPTRHAVQQDVLDYISMFYNSQCFTITNDCIRNWTINWTIAVRVITNQTSLK